MKRICALLVMGLIVACSSDNGTAPDDDDDGGGTGGGKVTGADTLWVENVGALANEMEAWAGQSPDTIAARALAYLQDLPSVEDAGIVPGTTTVWANFANGFDLVIPNNREPSSAADTLVDQSRIPPPRGEPRRISIPAGRRMTQVLSSPTSALEIPVSSQFRAVNAIGTCHINPLPVLRALLTAGNYVNANPPAPTVSNLKSTVHGDGVFYINSHGGPGFDQNQVAYYAVWTLDPIDVATLGNYRSMVTSHELVGMLEYSNDAQGNCTCVMHYGFTSTFVSKYMSFPKNSLVIVDACHSASGPAASLRAAFQTAGASVYVGWTKSVSAGFAYGAMKYLLDRMLGINIISPESPDQRAFNIDDVRDDMATNRNLVIDPANNSALTVFKLKDDFGLLAPSIQFVSFEQYATSDVLYVAGMFGTDPGEGKRAVTINGASLPVIDWQPDLIQCDITDDQAGTIEVEIGTGANARRSNPVNITSWEGEMTYERDDLGSLKTEMKIKVHFRADIHSFRDKPHEQPFETTVLFGPAHDTSVAATTEGTYSETFGDCTDTYTLSKGADLKSPHDADPDGGWIYFGSVDTQSHRLQLSMQVLTAFEAGRWVRSGDCEAFDKPYYVILAMEDCLFDDLAQTTAFRMQMGDDFGVPEDNRGPCDVESIIDTDQNVQVKIRWSAMPAIFPPDPNTAR